MIIITVDMSWFLNKETNALTVTIISQVNYVCAHVHVVITVEAEIFEQIFNSQAVDFVKSIKYSKISATTA